MSAAYRRKRVLAFWDPWSDPLDGGFQVIQSLIAVGAGGITGRGFMAGVQKLFYLPEPHTDFIFAVIGEEFGLDRHDDHPGLLRRDRMARHARSRCSAPDRFGSFLAVGLTTMIAAQALLEHQRRAGAGADQGYSAAVRELGRLVAGHQPAGHGHSAQRLPARGAGS